MMDRSRPADQYIAPGTHVALHDSGTGEIEHGVVLHCWFDDEIAAYDCYSAFFGPELPETSDSPPYVLRYAATTLHVEPSEGFSKKARNPRLQTVEVVLHWVWDPIGVRGIPEARDEYDGYALTVLGMLQRGSIFTEVADFLTSVEKDWMGLTPASARNAEVAELLLKLHGLPAA